MDSKGVKFEEIVDEMLQETQDWNMNNEDPGIFDNDNKYLH